tara:strand:- start:241 stop:1002 length:762 start_codon:yes stop_codon:yes gene_type:complete
MRIAEIPSQPRNVLGSFGKAVPGSAALNMGRSGGKNCWRGCVHHPDSVSPFASPIDTRCYAARCESRPDRQQLAAKLDRIEDADPDDVIDQADAELRQRQYRLPWFRLSAFGSVPDRIPAGFAGMLRRLHDAGTPIHFPIECPDRVNRYRDALPDGIAVRWSIPLGDGIDWITYPEPCSTVAGSMKDRPMKRIQDARDAASIRRKHTGRRTVVCPAIVTTTLRRTDKSVRAVKCGECRHCADPSVDVVYPVHS